MVKICFVNFYLCCSVLPSGPPSVNITIQFLSGTASCLKPFPPPGPPSVPILSLVGLSGDGNGAVNVTVNWTLIAGDSADFYLISITTNAPQTPYGGLLNTTTASVTQHELTGFIAGYEYNITVRGVNCKNQEGGESDPDNQTSRYTSEH